MSRRAVGAQSMVQRLSRALTLGVMLVWVLSTGLVGWYVDRQIQHNFDVELVESTHRQLYPALLDIRASHPSDAAGHYRALNRQGVPVEPSIMGEVPTGASAQPLLLQLRDASGNVLLRTPATPSSPLAVPLTPGFFDTDDFRVFSLYDPQSGVWLQLADPLDERHETSRRTLGGLATVLLVMLPVMAWLIRWIARRELRHLVHLQQQITARSGSNLEPVDLGGLPAELSAVGAGVNQLLERLGEALNVERSLSANAAHELRTPLTEVRLRLHTAVDKAAAEAAGACVPVGEVRAALQSLETLSHRTERLLELSRAEGGDSAHFARVNLVQLAEQVAQVFWQQPAARKRLDCVMPQGDAPVWVRGDIDGLAIVLRNLIDNALHYTDGEVVLEVVAAPAAALVVRDQGPGFTAEQLARLQVRHARLPSQHIGYGLGMSIVRSIAEKHGADLQWVSPPAGQAHGLEVRLVFGALEPGQARV
jgi:two-component system OmpR family sensor kinase